MRGHWISTTRRLNRHYQSGGGGGVGYTVDVHFRYATSENAPEINRITNGTGGLDIPLIPVQPGKRWTSYRYVISIRILDDDPAPLYLYPWTSANLSANVRLPIYRADGTFDRWSGATDAEFTDPTVGISPMIYSTLAHTWTPSSREESVYEIDRRLTFAVEFTPMAAGEYATYIRLAGLWMDTMEDDRAESGTYNIYYKNATARTIRFEVMPV